MAQFDWEDFFLETEGFFTGFADFLATRYDFVLIDSRTGMTDISSICTMVLPSKLVVVFTPNTQSLTGIEELIRKAVHYRLKSADERPLQVFPLPSRIPIDRPRLYQTWRYGGTTESSTVAIRGYQRVFEAVFAEVYDFTSLQNQFEDYFNQAQLQQISDYAYGEPIAVELEKDESRLSIRASYEAFLELLLELDGPWESLQDKRDTAAVRLRVEELHKALQEGAEDTALRFAYALLDQPWTESSLEEGLEAVVEVARKRALSSLSDAKALLLSAVTVAQRSCAQAGELQCAAFEIIARALLDIGAYAEAVEWARRVYTDYKILCGDDDIRTHVAAVQLGHTLYKTSAYEAAEQVFQSILLPPNAPATLPTAAVLAAEEGLARVQLAQGKLAEAEQSIAKVLQEKHIIPTVSEIDIAKTRTIQVEILLAKGMVAQARELQEEVLALQQRVLGPEHPDTLTSMHSLAETLRVQGELTGARTVQEQVLTLQQRVLGPEHPDTLTSMHKLAVPSPTVFLSYRREVSTFIARAIFQDLRQHGYDVFMDVESIDSRRFETVILSQIAARGHFLVILTYGTLEGLQEPNDWLRREIEYAMELRRNIVPILIDDFRFDANAYAYLTGRLRDLPRYNGLGLPVDYFDAAMERLRTRFLRLPA